MCNRYVQKGREVRPQQGTTVLMKGPGGYFELPFEAVFGGPARNESRNYWIKKEGPEPVLVPDISRFGEKDKAMGAQNWPFAAAAVMVLLAAVLIAVTAFNRLGQTSLRRIEG